MVPSARSARQLARAGPEVDVVRKPIWRAPLRTPASSVWISMPSPSRSSSSIGIQIDRAGMRACFGPSTRSKIEPERPASTFA